MSRSSGFWWQFLQKFPGSVMCVRKSSSQLAVVIVVVVVVEKVLVLLAVVVKKIQGVLIFVLVSSGLLFCAQ